MTMQLKKKSSSTTQLLLLVNTLPYFFKFPSIGSQNFSLSFFLVFFFS